MCVCVGGGGDWSPGGRGQGRPGWGWRWGVAGASRPFWPGNLCKVFKKKNSPEEDVTFS